jgi:hypothetical protein
LSSLVAENIEERALRLANEERDTTAARLMQRFATGSVD